MLAEAVFMRIAILLRSIAIVVAQHLMLS